MSQARLNAIKLKQLLSSAYTWDNAQTFTRVKEKIVRESASGTYTVDLSKGVIFNIELTGNTTFIFPLPDDGAQFTMNLTQDATGGRSVTWPSTVRWGSDLAPTITTEELKTDTISFVCQGNYWLGYESTKNYNTSLGPVSWTFTYSSIWPSASIPTQSNMSDGGSLTYWGNAVSENDPYLLADFGQPYFLSYVKYLASPTSQSWGPNFINGAVLQHSLDGNSWTNILTISGASESTVAKYILPSVVSARYVRLFRSGNGFLACGDLSFG